MYRKYCLLAPASWRQKPLSIIRSGEIYFGGVSPVVKANSMVLALRSKEWELKQADCTLTDVGQKTQKQGNQSVVELVVAPTEPSFGLILSSECLFLSSILPGLSSANYEGLLLSVQSTVAEYLQQISWKSCRHKTWVLRLCRQSANQSLWMWPTITVGAKRKPTVPNYPKLNNYNHLVCLFKITCSGQMQLFQDW